MERDDMFYLKVDSKGKLVDIRSLTRNALQSLVGYYQIKLKNARSEDMKKACNQCVEQISEFMYERKVHGPPDVFTICHYAGNKDVRTFIKTYLGKIQTQEEIIREKVMRYYRNRKFLFPGFTIPSDEIVRGIFKAVVLDRPPLPEKAAALFTEYYKIDMVKVKLSNFEYLTFYDLESSTIVMNLERAQIQLGLLEAILIGLFEHLCQKKSWQFNSDPEVRFVKQREITTKFVEQFFFRCSGLGLLPPPRRS